MKPIASDIARHLPRATLAALVPRLDRIGIVEHARGATPSADFGYCTDDAGRALALAMMVADDPNAGVIAASCLRQLDRSLHEGRFWLRLDGDGHPVEPLCSDDSTGRALWGLALAAIDGQHVASAHAAVHILELTADFESAHPRAAAHAVIAGTVLLAGVDTSRRGRRLIDANLANIPRAGVGEWRWPEQRLTYGNAILPEALLAAGAILDDEMINDGLDLLAWLTDLEWDPGGHFSFTSTRGRGPGDASGFDQQPIEAWAMASACRAAFDITHDLRWFDALGWLAAWFDGANDHGIRVWDERTGAAFDGLTATGVNENQGTESNLALIGTLHAWETARLVNAEGYDARRSSSR